MQSINHVQALVKSHVDRARDSEGLQALAMEKTQVPSTSQTLTHAAAVLLLAMSLVLNTSVFCISRLLVLTCACHKHENLVPST